MEGRPNGSEERSDERLELVHTAGTWTEAVVIRSLLASAGIDSPNLAPADPYPMRQPPGSFSSVEIYVPESQAEEARHIIEESVRAAPKASPEPSSEF